MKRFSLLIFTITMLALILLLGSCSPVVPATVGGGMVIQEASAGAVLPLNSSEEQSWDSTAFLVGEFNGSNGSIARFNGFGELTLIAVDGSQSCGSYSLTEYEKKPATVVIELSGARCEYTFALSDGSGAFTLTDAAGSSYTFTPVIY